MRLYVVIKEVNHFGEDPPQHLLKYLQAKNLPKPIFCLLPHSLYELSNVFGVN